MRALAVLSVLLLIACVTNAAPRQFLPPMAGYVPVYIQDGDTPLEEINLELAEAFHVVPSGRSASGHDSIMAETNSDDEAEEKHKHKKHEKRSIDWSQESLDNDDNNNDSLEFEIQEALSRPDQNYDRSIDLQILSKTDDKR